MNFDRTAFGEKARGFVQTAGEKAKKAAAEVRGRADRAAGVLAAKVTEVTGSEMTATEGKRAAAVVAGAVVLGTAAVAVAGDRRGWSRQPSAAGRAGRRWTGGQTSRARRSRGSPSWAGR
jgi:hypothetical protein